MPNKSPFVDGKYLLQKFPGKGGWTYADIPEITQNKNNPFGWVEVTGSIDDFELNHYKLMPKGNGKLFLPVKTEIRKKIKKEAGDQVHIRLVVESRPYTIPEELQSCFEFESKSTLDNFNMLTPGEQKAFVDWIYDAKTDETKVKRIAEMLRKLQS